MSTNLTAAEMKQFVRNHFEDFVNKRNAGVIRKNMAPDFYDHDGPGGKPTGVDGDEQMMLAMYKAMPDLHLERSLGIARKSEIAEIDGFDATVLWAKYLRGDNAALENLIDYNTEDVVHLKAIMEICYDKMSERTGEYLRQSMPSLFAGVSEVPKSPSDFGSH